MTDMPCKVERFKDEIGMIGMRCMSCGASNVGAGILRCPHIRKQWPPLHVYAGWAMILIGFAAVILAIWAGRP